MKSGVKNAAQWFGVFVGVWILFHFVFPIAVVDGPSMKPTLKSGDFVLCSALDRSYQRGDVIVLRNKKTKEVPYAVLIKRIAAILGDVIEMNTETGVIFVNGKPAVNQERAALPELETISFPATVPEGQLFVLGDNPAQSMDSRYKTLGFIAMQNVVGVVKYPSLMDNSSVGGGA